MLSAGSVLFDRRGVGPFPPVIEEIQKIKNEAIQSLGNGNADYYWSLGKTMSFEEVITFALDEVEPME